MNPVIPGLAIIPLILIGLDNSHRGGGILIAGAVFCALYVGYCMEKEK